MKKLIYFVIIPLLIIGVSIKIALATLHNPSPTLPPQAQATTTSGQMGETDVPVAPVVATASTTASTTKATAVNATSTAKTATSATSAENTATGPRTKIIEYTVQSGDVIGSIAEKFGISVNTILWANGLSATSLIRPGEKLTILPVDGVEYTVKSGDTLSRISSLYGVDADKISSTNDLGSNAVLKVGQELIIPGGKQLASTSTHTASASGSTVSSPSAVVSSGITWTSGALSELYKVPYYVRSIVRNKINAYAKSHNIHVITKQIYDSIRV